MYLEHVYSMYRRDIGYIRQNIIILRIRIIYLVHAVYIEFIASCICIMYTGHCAISWWLQTECRHKTGAAVTGMYEGVADGLGSHSSRKRFLFTSFV